MSRLSSLIRSLTRSFTDASSESSNTRRRERERRRKRYNSPDRVSSRSRGERDSRTQTKAANDESVERLVTVNEDVRSKVEGNARSKPYDPVFLRDISANAVVQAYIDTLSQDVASVNWSIKPRDEDADIDDSQLSGVERELKRLPPGNRTFRDVLESTARVLLELGDAGLVKHYFEDDPNRVAEIVPVDSASMFKLVDNHGLTTGYVQVSKRHGTKEQEFDVDDVVWVEWSNRPDRFYGQGPLEKAQNEVELIEELAEKERLDLMQGGPPGVLSPESLDEYGGLPNDEDWDAFVEQMRLDDGERHRVGYAKHPVDFTAINNNYQELQILSRSKYWVTVLGSVFKVNPSYAGFDFENTNRATDETQQAAYRQRGFRVLLRQLEEGLNRGLVWSEFSRDIKLEFERETTVEERAERASLLETQASAGMEMADAGREVSYRDGKLVVEDGEIEEGSDDGGGLFASVDTESVGKEVPDSIVDTIGEDRFVPPEGAASNAQRALDLIEEHGREEASGGTEEALGRARQIIRHVENDEPLTGADSDGVPYVVEIANFFGRHRAQGNHEYDADEYDAKYQDPGWLADMLWGGDASESWATPLSDDIDDAESEGVLKHVDSSDFVYDSETDARTVARMLGLSGIHSHEEDDGSTTYMPGDTHDELTAAIEENQFDHEKQSLPDNAVSVSDPSEAPEDAKIVEGPRGGTYYIPEVSGFEGLSEYARSDEARQTLSEVEEAYASEDIDLLARQNAETALRENTSINYVSVSDFDSKEAQATVFAEIANLDAEGYLDNVNDVRAGLSEDTLETADVPPRAVYNVGQESVEWQPDGFEAENNGEEMAANADLSEGIDPLAVDTQEGYIRHEVGHAAYKSEVGMSGVRELREAGWEGVLGDEWDEDTKLTVAEEVSAYGAMSPSELVAEVFAGKLSGEEYSEEIDRIYEEIGGPEV